jgi:hypothetical protein
MQHNVYDEVKEFGSIWIGEGAARQWSKLEVSGATPKPSNYSKLAVWGTHIVCTPPCCDRSREGREVA